MDDLSFKVGGYEAEPLTVMVTTPKGKLFLTRTMPGRWRIQRAGTPNEPATPTWDGEVFRIAACTTAFRTEELPDSIKAAARALDPASSRN